MKPFTKARRSKVRRIEPSEHQIQSAYFDWVRLAYPGCKLIYAVPNGGKRHIVTAMKMQREGVTPGMPDVNIDVPKISDTVSDYYGMRIEVKTKKGALNAAQKEAHIQLESVGIWVVVCRSTESMIEETKRYLGDWKP